MPESIVVNIGDLMAMVSGGRFVATMHRVRAPPSPTRKDRGMVDDEDEDGEKGMARFGRFSVPFFFEPGERCLVQSVDAASNKEGVVYGDHVRAKMESFVEYKRDQI